MVTSDTLSRDFLIEEYKVAFMRISNGWHSEEYLPSFPKDFSAIKQVILRLGSAVDKVHHTYIENGWHANQPDYEGGSANKVFCHSVAKILMKNNFSREEFVYLIENSSCGLIAYVFGNLSLPIDLLLETELDDEFQDDPYYRTLKSFREKKMYYWRKEEIFTYLREELNNNSIDTSTLTDEMVAKISGYNFDWM